MREAQARPKYALHTSTYTKVNRYICPCVRVCARTRVYGRKVTGSHSTRAKMFSYSAPLDLGRCYGPSRNYNELLQNDGGAELYSLYTYIRWTGEHKEATFRSRCCPQVLSRRRRFYSERLLLGALASEAATLLPSFSS
jgi:hypothetical protein